MSRFWIISVIATVVFSLLTASDGVHVEAIGIGAAQTPTTVVSTEANIVFILTDDLNARLLARHLDSFPNIKALKENGVSFSNSFVTEPVCCPSRVTSLTGMYPHNHGVEQGRGGGEAVFRASLEDVALPVWLDAAGYRTGYMGKYVNGYDDDHVPPGWDVWHGTGIRKTESGVPYVPGYDTDGRNRRGETHTQTFARLAASFVENSGPEPFFAYVAPYAPHEPAAHPARYDELFTGVHVPRRPSFNEADVSDKPEWVRDRERLSGEEVAEANELYRDMLRSMKDVDDMIGKIVGALKASGELENTYVVFSSDNGYHWGEHRLPPGKWSPYEEDIKVPLIVRGPGVPAGETRTQIVLNNDLAPTFAEWAGAQPMTSVDGRSLVPLISSSPPVGPWREAFLVEAIAEKRSGRPLYHAVRTRKHLYVEYGSGERELYALGQDPHELENVVRVADAALKAGLKTRLEALKGCAGESCRTVEN